MQVFDERKALVGKWVSFLFGKTQHAAENFVCHNNHFSVCVDDCRDYVNHCNIHSAGNKHKTITQLHETKQSK